jgi:predicted methyltransferase
MPLRHAVGATLIALLAVTAATSVAWAASPAITAAIADAGRPAKDVAQDASRKPAELIEFARVKPGDTVMDIWPGGGYWTRIFSKVVGPTGKVYAYVPAEIAGFKQDPEGGRRRARPGQRGRGVRSAGVAAAGAISRHSRRCLDL